MSSIAAGVRLNKLFADVEVLKAEVASLKARIAALEIVSETNLLPPSAPTGVVWNQTPKRRGRPPKFKHG